MATKTYRVQIRDLGEAPFPGASPEVRIIAPLATTGAGGNYAQREIPVVLNAQGIGTFELVPSRALNPQMNYQIRVRWLDSNGVPRGVTTWEFTALVGGGNIASMNPQVVYSWVINFGPGKPEDFNIHDGIFVDTSGTVPVFYLPEKARL